MRERQKYKIFDSAIGKNLGSFNSTEVKELIGLEQSNVCRYATDGKIYKKRYIVSFDDKARVSNNQIPDSMWKEWSRVRVIARNGLAKSDPKKRRIALNELQPLWREKWCNDYE